MVWGAFTWGNFTWGQELPPIPDGAGSDYLPTFGLAVADLPTEEAQVISTIDPTNVDVSWTSTIWGGYNEASVGFATDEGGWPMSFFAQEVDLRVQQHAMLVLGTSSKFVGRIVELNRPVYGQVRGCSISGYGIEGMNDDWWREGGTDDIDCHRILLQAISERAPMLSLDPTSLVCNHVTHTRDEFIGMTPGQIAEVLVNEGGLDVKAFWLLTIFDDGLAEFRPLIQPTEPDYIVQLDDTTPLRESAREHYGAVTMSYKDADGNQKYTDRYESGDFLTNYKFMRDKLLDGASGSVTQASVFAQTWLQQHSVPEWSGQIKREGWHGLQRPNGAWVAPCDVKPGEWVYYEGRDLYLPITQCSVQITPASNTSPAAMSSTFELGFPPTTTVEGFFRDIQRTSSAYRNAVNPLTRAREPFGRLER